MATLNIIKGSSFLFQGTVKGLPSTVHLGDTNVSVSAVFYISGTYTKETATKVTVAKTDMNTSTTSNDFSCYVDTSSLSSGTLACAITVEYPSGTKTLKEIIPVTIENPLKITTLS